MSSGSTSRRFLDSLRSLGMTAIALAGCASPSPVPPVSPVQPVWSYHPDAPRPYRLFLPANVRPGAPLVVLLHGCTQDAAEFAAATRMNEYAAEAGAIVVYPEQPASANPQKCWNWFLPAHQARGSGEPAIIAGIADSLARAHRADPRRIYIGGLSAGAAMAVVTAVAYPDRFAAVASHSGIGWGVASDVASALAAMRSGGASSDSLVQGMRGAMGPHARPLPIFVVHGTADAVVTPRASRVLLDQFAGLHRVLEPRADELRGMSFEEAGGYRYERVTVNGTNNRLAIEAWFVDSLGHALSGGAPGARWTDSRGPNAARGMLQFFLEHPRAR